MKMRSFQMIIALVLMASSVFSQRPTIELTFIAKYQSQHVMLDSISIQNLTQPGDTMLFAPDTVLFLEYIISIPDNGGVVESSFSVSPNYPNPSTDGKTTIDVFIPKREFVKMRVFNILGNEVAVYENTLDPGNHHFTFLAGKARYYVLSVNSGNEIRSVKMINSCNSNQEQGTLIYEGSTETEPSMKSQEATAGFDFLLGDQLQYTAFASGYQASVIVDIPESSKTFTFEMVSSVFTCGNSLTINHVTGEVAPVNKTVTYGTVTNIPGEPSKCWITSNLGADHQATAKNDATEPSAGWYWQFNLKQGYKHDGTTRTPNTAWVTNIEENSDWIPTNDPCAIELGVDWRIPTSAEWQNVDANGNWADWNGPWNSGLKLHAAGLLGNNDGLLYDRGSSGLYWSNNQYSTTDGSSIHFSNGFCSMFNFPKAGGFPMRCVNSMFICGDVVNYEGENYNTIHIGTQCWFKENLNVGTMIDGIESQTNNSVIEKFCYDNLESNCSVYGGLYQWDEMMQYSTAGGVQGICPAGWHLPTDAGLTTLTTCVSSKTANRCNSNVDYIAKSMAATTNWNTSTSTCAIGNNLAANNATGFTGLSSGYRDTDGAFLGIGSYGYFWSSTQVSSTDAWSRGLHYYNAYVRQYYGPKGYGFSVRCVRD